MTRVVRRVRDGEAPLRPVPRWVRPAGLVAACTVVAGLAFVASMAAVGVDRSPAAAPVASTSPVSLSLADGPTAAVLVDGWVACVARDRDRVAAGDRTYASILPKSPRSYGTASAVSVESDGPSLEYTARIGVLTFICRYDTDARTADVAWNTAQ